MRQINLMKMSLLFFIGFQWPAFNAVAQNTCVNLFSERSANSNQFYKTFESDFKKAIKTFVQEVVSVKQSRPRLYSTVAQTFKDLGFKKSFTAEKFNTRYLQFMTDQVREKTIEQADILMPGLVFKNKSGEIKIVPFGEEVPVGDEWNLRSTLGRLDFFQVLDKGYFPIGNPQIISSQTKTAVVTHDLTGHFGAFMRDPIYMKDIKKFAGLILKKVKSENDFSVDDKLTRIGQLGEFFLEQFKYVPRARQNILFSNLLLSKGTNPLAIKDQREMMHHLSAFQTAIVENKIKYLLENMDDYVSRLGGLERDDGYQLKKTIGSDRFLTGIREDVKIYYESSPRPRPIYANMILANLQLYLINLSRFTAGELVNQLTRDSGPQPELLNILASDEFYKAHPYMRILLRENN